MAKQPYQLIDGGPRVKTIEVTGKQSGDTINNPFGELDVFILCRNGWYATNNANSITLQGPTGETYQGSIMVLATQTQGN